MRDLILMPLIQIGELIAHFKDGEYLELFPQVPWREIKGSRNIIVHGYGHIDPAMAWEAATTGISELRAVLLGNDEVRRRYEEEAAWSTDSSAMQGSLEESIQSLPAMPETVLLTSQRKTQG